MGYGDQILNSLLFRRKLLQQRVPGKEQGNKKPPPLPDDSLKGRECQAVFSAVPAGMPAHSLHTRGATLIVTACCFAFSSHRRDGWWHVTTFSRFFRCMGTTHPCLLTSAGCPARDFLRLAAHEGVRGGPIHSELPLCFGSLSVTASRTLFVQRGTVCYELVFQGYQ